MLGNTVTANNNRIVLYNTLQITNMRKRFNRSAICSVDGNSGSYETSRKAHKEMLQEKHSHFCGMMVSGEIKIDVPTITSDGKVEPKFKTVTIFGKQMTLTIEEYNTHYAKCNF